MTQVYITMSDAMKGILFALEDISMNLEKQNELLEQLVKIIED